MPHQSFSLEIVLGGTTSRYVLGPLAGLEFARLVGHPCPAAVLDGAVARLHPERLQQIQAGCRGPIPPPLILPGGEDGKTLDGLQRVYAWLADLRLARDQTLVAVGGGALLDLVGMAAATWRRGVDFVSIPTTLLAMVDAAIGGKTAVNAVGLKNPVGCFHPAKGIIADPGFLVTLPRAGWRDGMAELVKAAAIGDPALFAELHGSRARLFNLFGEGDPARPIPGVLNALPWQQWIGRAAAVKARIVSRDFTERGLRRALNLGHTLGHALEAHSRTTDHPLSHGQAVAVGMAVVFRIAAERGDCPLPAAVQMIEVLEACGLPVCYPAPAAADLDDLLAGDKKQTSRGGLNWVVPVKIGQVSLAGRIATGEILKWLDRG